MSLTKCITVFGSARSSQASALYRQARALGAAIARQGWILCNGGYGGTMEASARGAREAGAQTIGVTCTLFRRAGPNRHITDERPTSDLFGRLRLLIALGDGYVVLPGGSGTLVELALVTELIAKRLSRSKPIVLLGEHWRGVEAAIRQQQPARRGPMWHFADSPEAAVAALQRRLRGR